MRWLAAQVRLLRGEVDFLKRAAEAPQGKAAVGEAAAEAPDGEGATEETAAEAPKEDTAAEEEAVPAKEAAAEALATSGEAAAEAPKGEAARLIAAVEAPAEKAAAEEAAAESPKGTAAFEAPTEESFRRPQQRSWPQQSEATAEAPATAAGWAAEAWADEPTSAELYAAWAKALAFTGKTAEQMDVAIAAGMAAERAALAAARAAKEKKKEEHQLAPVDLVVEESAEHNVEDLQHGTAAAGEDDATEAGSWAGYERAALVAERAAQARAEEAWERRARGYRG